MQTIFIEITWTRVLIVFFVEFWKIFLINMKDGLSLIIVCSIIIIFICVKDVLIHVKLVNWSIFVWLLLLLSLWIVSFIYDYSFYSIIWVDLRFGLCIDWSCFKNMFIMIELQLHVWIQRQFWVVMFKLRSCIFVLLLLMLFLSLKIDFIFVSVAIRFAVFETNFTCCDSLCMCI